MIPKGELIPAQVLIIEDEPLNATLITALLAVTGIGNAHICTSGAELTEMLQRVPSIDLVLLDLQLPGEDGFEVCSRLRAQSHLVKVPIFAVSALVTPDTVARAEQSSFDGFIGKPLQFDRFPSQIRRALAGEKFWEAR